MSTSVVEASAFYLASAFAVSRKLGRFFSCPFSISLRRERTQGLNFSEGDLPAPQLRREMHRATWRRANVTPLSPHRGERCRNPAPSGLCAGLGCALPAKADSAPAARSPAQLTFLCALTKARPQARPDAGRRAMRARGCNDPCHRLRQACYYPAGWQSQPDKARAAKAGADWQGTEADPAGRLLP